MSLHSVILTNFISPEISLCQFCDDAMSIERDEIPTEIVKEPFKTESTSTQWPCVWSESNWLDKVSKYPFLVCSNGKLGCKICKQVGGVQTLGSQGVSLSPEWSKCQIVPNGKDCMQQLRSLRKKICEHVISKAHINASKILAAASKDELERVVKKIKSHDEDMTKKVFRTAYYLAKNDRLSLIISSYRKPKVCHLGMD